MKKVSAYGVHLLTASGAALGLWGIILTYDGFYHEAIWALAAAALVDSVDGYLARLADVKMNAPAIDGALMDNIIDFISWTVAPLLWIYATMDLPVWALMICATASVFGFSNMEAKTKDYFFKGFPSYWNIVVFYIFLLQLPTVMATAIILIFALATFMPIKYVYPSRTPFLRPITLILAGVYILQLIGLMYYFDNSPVYLIYSSFLFPFYYFGLSFYMNLRTDVTSA